MKFIGIDPGLNGAVCILENSKVSFFDTPTFMIKGGKKDKREYNTVEMAEYLSFSKPGEVIVALEKSTAAGAYEYIPIWKGIWNLVGHPGST